MASNVKVTVLVEVDGEPVRGFPLQRRFSVDETQSFAYEKTSGAGFADIPDNQLTTGQFTLLQPDRTVSFRFSDGAGAAAAVAVNAGGFLLVFDGSWANGIEVENTSGSTALIKGVVGGT
jgi:hypothetical protein